MYVYGIMDAWKRETLRFMTSLCNSMISRSSMFAKLLTSTTVAPLPSLGPSRSFLKVQKEVTRIASASVTQIQSSDWALKLGRNCKINRCAAGK
jgi:hypothetical protein